MDKYLQAITTTDSQEEAAKLARLAVERRVAACAQVAGPITSTYWWKGAVETASEWQVLFKLPGERYETFQEVIRSAHSYDVPEIIAMPIAAGNPAYLEWITAETSES
jgi:periplasmic divalent cation tolerance protein